MNETDWLPDGYDKKRWTPDHDEMYRLHIKEVRVSDDPVKPPALVISLRVVGRWDGKQKWSGSIYMNFGRSDTWDYKTGKLVLFFLSVAREPVTPKPEWSEVSSGVAFHAFLGRLTANDYKGRRYHNLVSIQRAGRELEQGVMNYWTTDGMVFRSSSCDDLISTEEYDGPPECLTADGYPCDEEGNRISNKKYIPKLQEGEPVADDAVIAEMEDDAVIGDMDDAPPTRTPLKKGKATGPMLEADDL